MFNNFKERTMEKYLKKNAPVIYHYQELREVMWSDTGVGLVPCHKKAVMIDNPRDEYGRFASTEDEYNTVKIKTEDGRIFTTELRNIEPNRDIVDLSKEEVKKLWDEIKKGSMYYSDYSNSLGVFENVAMDYYEGYAEQCENENEEETADGFYWYIMSAA